MSEMIGYIPCYFYIEKVGRKKVAFWMFLVAIISSFILVFVKKPKQCDMCPESIVEMVVIFFFRFAISTEFIFFLVYIVELFPTRLVGLGVGACNVAGAVASTISPIFLGVLTRI